MVADRRQNPDFYDATVAYYREHSVAPTLCERHIPSPGQLYELVASRQGVTLLPHEARDIPGVVRIPYSGQPPPGLATVYLVWRTRSADRLMKLLIATAQEYSASL
jgi:DNA-binding transcriptional LysR family regulator